MEVIFQIKYTVSEAGVVAYVNDLHGTWLRIQWLLYSERVQLVHPSFPLHFCSNSGKIFFLGDINFLK